MLDINKMLQIQGMYALARGGVKLKFFISTVGSIMKTETKGDRHDRRTGPRGSTTVLL